MTTHLLTLTLLALTIHTTKVAAADAARDTTRKAICQTFRHHCHEALRVAWCESRYNTRARNGQYHGLFQMGDWERRTYGHGHDAWTQARAAYRYFVASGRDWSPWECKP